MMPIRSIKNVDIKDKVVIVRTDYNVPIENGIILDNTRILESIENIKFILSCLPKKVVIITHLGRPLGSVVDDFRLKPVVNELQSLLGEEVDYFDQDINQISRKLIEQSLHRVVCLENIRFDRREEDGSDDLAKIIASFGDIFVLDGFSVAHRAHASVTKIAKFLPACAGLSFIREYEGINDFLTNINKPFWGFFGGIKLADKMPVIQALSAKLDGIVFGSSIAIAFLKRFGFGVGDSLVTSDSDLAVDSFMEFKSENNIKIIFPSDLIVGDVVSYKPVKVFDIDFEQVFNKSITPFSICDSGEAIFDVGEKSSAIYGGICQNSRTIFWNGPFGYAEKELFSKGTERLANVISDSKAKNLIGGGDTIAIMSNLNLLNKFNFISTSGGSMMEYIAKGTIPGIDILLESK